MRNVLLTRTQEENNRLEPILQDMHFIPISIPLVKRYALDVDINQYSSCTNILITSKFAAQILSQRLRFNANFFVVGQESANIIANNPYANITQIFETTKDIKLPYENNIYFHGNHLTKIFPIKMVELYHSIYHIQDLNTPNRTLINCVLIFSSMACKYFLDSAKYSKLDLSNTTIICISKSVAELCHVRYPNSKILYPQIPNEAEMLKLLAQQQHIF